MTKITAPALGMLLVLVAIFNAQTAQAVDSDLIQLHLDQATVEKGYTIKTPSENLIMGIFPNVLDRPALITLKQINEEIPIPEDLKMVSPLYEFDILTDPIKIFAKEVIVVLKYDSGSVDHRQIRYWDSIKEKWIALYSVDIKDISSVRAFTHLPYSKIAVFEEVGYQEGYASWYRDANRPMTASSNNYNISEYVKVTNTANQKSVTVKIVSIGPFVKGRIIDLSSDAFLALESLGEGIITVRVEPKDETKETQTETTDVLSNAPAITASSALVYDPTDGRIIYQKNPQTVPIASITKLMTVLIFLESPGGTSLIPYDQSEIVYESTDNVNTTIESFIPMNQGDRLAVDEALKAVLINSANNITKTLVRASGYTQQEFVDRMNDAARRLGMTNSLFVETTGINAGNVSTPKDVAKLINYLMTREGIRIMSITKYDRISANTGTDHERIIELKNSNHILDKGLPIYGGKTGYLGTDMATFGLKFVSGDKQRIVVLLGSHTGSSRNQDMIDLGDWAMEQ
ncbi:MAG: RlpA-like double-psi beta-barrel domain-containing protein [bacterium]